jgi:O6-methylguanine-DNA--protein-cysteine methyltransferase
VLRKIYCWEIQDRKLKIYLASSENGAVMVEMSLVETAEDCLSYFRNLFPESRLQKNRERNGPLIDAVQSALANRPVPEGIPLDVSGTPFQMAAWRAIARIPYGTTRTYAEVARMVGKPLAARAVGQAMGRNPLPLFFP